MICPSLASVAMEPLAPVADELGDGLAAPVDGLDPHAVVSIAVKVKALTRSFAGIHPNTESGYVEFLLGGYVGGGQAAVDQERGAVHVARLVAREKQRSIRDLARLGESAHRQVPPPPAVPAGARVSGAAHS